MTGSTSEIDKAALGKEYDMTTVVHKEAVDLGLDVLDRFGICFQPGNIDLDVKMSDVWE